jgi:hypothetical protein
MPRRLGWLRDYHHELDQGNRVLPTDDDERYGPGPRASSPVTVNVNINVGDLLKKLVQGESTAKEALEELAKELKEEKRIRLEEARDED